MIRSLLKFSRDSYQRQKEDGKIGYALLWLLGVPLPVLLFFYFIRGA